MRLLNKSNILQYVNSHCCKVNMIKVFRQIVGDNIHLKNSSGSVLYELPIEEGTPKNMVEAVIKEGYGFYCIKCGLWLSVVEKEHGAKQYKSQLSRRDKPKHDITKQRN